MGMQMASFIWKICILFGVSQENSLRRIASLEGHRWKIILKSILKTDEEGKTCQLV